MVVKIFLVDGEDPFQSARLKYRKSTLVEEPVGYCVRTEPELRWSYLLYSSRLVKCSSAVLCKSDQVKQAARLPWVANHCFVNKMSLIYFYSCNKLVEHINENFIE